MERLSASQDGGSIRSATQRLITEKETLFALTQSDRDNGVDAELWPTRRRLLHLQEMACRQDYLDGGCSENRHAKTGLGGVPRRNRDAIAPRHNYYSLKPTH